MSFRTTIGLLVVLAFLGGYVYFVEARKPPEEPKTPPRTVVLPTEPGDILQIEVRHAGEKTAVIKDEARKGKVWRFNDPPEYPPIEQTRMGGILVLLAGLRAERSLAAETAINLADYGLDKPQTEVYVGTRDGRQLAVFLGAVNPSGEYQYWRAGNSKQVHLIVRSVGDILAQFVTDPPVLQPETISEG